VPGVRLAIVVSEVGPRLATALTLAAAAAALGRDVAMLFDGASVAALIRPDPLLAAAFDLGVRVTACQTGLAGAGIAANELPPEVTTGGMVAFLGAAGDAQIVLA
jgi:peroxiredoxin family protein